MCNYLTLCKMLAIYRLWIVVVLLVAFKLEKTIAKVADYGPRLIDFLKEHPDKGWLIKFYAPWCHHCNQLEPTYIKLAEKIYHKYDDLIVGQVDCTKYSETCQKFGVLSFPTILYLKGVHEAIMYKGERELNSIASFAERVHGPDINRIQDCDDIFKTKEEHGLIILSTQRDLDSKLYTAFKSVASSLKNNYWFYHISKKCDLAAQDNRLYLLKRHLNRAVEFRLPEESRNGLNKSIIDWIDKESFPIFGRVRSSSIDHYSHYGKILMLAILDEYSFARSFTQSSKKFYETFERISKKFAQVDDKIIFAWSSDIELAQTITIGHVSPPNVLILKPDWSYHLLAPRSFELKKSIPLELNSGNIISVIQAIKDDKLHFNETSSIYCVVIRQIYKYLFKILALYQGNPILAIVLFGLPTITLTLVLYSYCYLDSQSENPADDEDGVDADDRQRLINHLKQD